MKSNGSSLYKCSISYSTLKRSFAPRIWTTTSGAQHIIHNTFNSSSWVVLSIFGGLFAGVGGLEVNNRGFGCEMRCLALFESNFEFESGINFFGLTVWEIGGLAYLIWSKHIGLKYATPHVQRMKPL